MMIMKYIILKYELVKLLQKILQEYVYKSLYLNSYT